MPAVQRVKQPHSSLLSVGKWVTGLGPATHQGMRRRRPSCWAGGRSQPCGTCRVVRVVCVCVVSIGRGVVGSAALREPSKPNKQRCVTCALYAEPGREAAVATQTAPRAHWHSLDGNDTPLHVCQLLEGPNTDVHMVLRVSGGSSQAGVGGILAHNPGSCASSLGPAQSHSTEQALTMSPQHQRLLL